MRCDICGKFAKIVDWYAPFGGSQDEDPPSDVLMCQKCVDKEIDYCRKTKSMPYHWCPAKFENGLAKELGFEWFVLDGCAWGRWRKITAQ